MANTIMHEKQVPQSDANSRPRHKLVMGLAVMMTLSACEGENGKQAFGTILGATIGAIVGSEIDGGRNRGAGIALGMMLGSAFGGEIGRKLDEADRVMASNAYHNSMEYGVSGESSDWYNPDSGHSGSYTPQPAYKDQEERYCREYTQTVTIGGKEENAYGRACRQPDGSWEIVSDK